MDAQKKWKLLSPLEKGRIVHEFTKFQSETPKKISEDEKKLANDFQGIPRRRYMRGYNVFVEKFAAKYTGDKSNLMKATAQSWKSASEVEKLECQQAAKKDYDDWLNKMKKFSETLDPLSRAELESTYKLKRVMRKRKQPTELGTTKKSRFDEPPKN